MTAANRSVGRTANGGARLRASSRLLVPLSAAHLKRFGFGAERATSVIYWPMGKAIVNRSPDILGGTPVFAGTRVPIQTLIDYLEGGESIDDFLKGFPTVKREQVIAFLEEAKTRVVASGV